jgi:hypothetical protein
MIYIIILFYLLSVLVACGVVAGSGAADLDGQPDPATVWFLGLLWPLALLVSIGHVLARWARKAIS